jgi:glycosyltransferase involved in cell wall biosynthesis
MNTPICINGRFASQRITGVQRYARAVTRQLQEMCSLSVIRPPHSVAGRTGLDLLWEQIGLPRRVPGNAALWSPTGSGPLIGGPHVVTLHDGAVLSHPEWFTSTYAAWRRFFIPHLVRRADAVITVSNFSKQHLKNYVEIDEDRIVAIHNGCNHNRFRPVDEEAQKSVRRNLNLPPVFVLALASLEPRKNFQRLLKAWHVLEQEASVDIPLVIAGGRPKHLKDGSGKTEPQNVRYLGYVDDEILPSLYSAATIFVYPSVFEGFGLPVLEAMACGTSVLTSDAASLPEVAGEAAELVDPYSIEAIAEGIHKLIRNDEHRAVLREKGLKRVKKFTWRRTAERTLNVLKAV